MGALSLNNVLVDWLLIWWRCICLAIGSICRTGYALKIKKQEGIITFSKPREMKIRKIYIFGLMGTNVVHANSQGYPFEILK